MLAARAPVLLFDGAHAVLRGRLDVAFEYPSPPTPRRLPVQGDDVGLLVGAVGDAVLTTSRGPTSTRTLGGGIAAWSPSTTSGFDSVAGPHPVPRP